METRQEIEACEARKEGCAVDMTLEPCPFCGGEDGKHPDDCYITMLRDNTSFINLHHKPMYRDEEMREAYNTRYKRTCHVIKKRQEAGECSECGGFLFAANGCLPKQWTHCPNCGAEVADGD